MLGLLEKDRNVAGVVRGEEEIAAEQVLDRAVQLFWEKGYQASSVADIVEATGLNKSSLYNAFGSKEALVERAINRYLDTRTAMLTGTLTDGCRGCLAVNTSTERGYRDDAAKAVSTRYRVHIRVALNAVFARAEEQGEITPGVGAAYAELLLGWMLGMAVVVRGGADRSELAGQFKAARTLIEHLRIA